MDVAAAAALLRQGSVLAFPTETVYGLGAVIDHPHAVARVFELKERPRFDPLIVHLADANQLAEVWTHVCEQTRRLAERFWPGPLTLLGPKTDRVADLVTAGLSRVAVRVPAHPVARDLLLRVGAPVAAPSANRFGGISPTSAEAVRAEFGDRLPVLDGGPCSVGVESTVLSWTDAEEPVLLRPGGVSVEALTDALGPIRIPAPDEQQRLSPGRLPKHYAPRTPVGWKATLPPGPSRGLLAFRAPAPSGYGATEILSPTGDLNEAATRLFAALRHLDRAGLEAIAVEPVPEEGLGRAIMDRLRRAMGKGNEP
jgi:L-threonylcarbamoyladenylate synthase